jgi:hypothetical protein
MYRILLLVLAIAALVRFADSRDFALVPAGIIAAVAWIAGALGLSLAFAFVGPAVGLLDANVELLVNWIGPLGGIGAVCIAAWRVHVRFVQENAAIQLEREKRGA